MSDQRNGGGGSGTGSGAAGWVGPALIYGGAALIGAAMFQAKRNTKALSEHPPIGRFLEAGGTTFHYTDVGEGPPVVLIHGVGATLEDWFISGLVDHLMAHHRVIAIDRPGYGYTQRPDRIDWTPERQARAIAALLERLGVREATIVGHSYGVLPAIAMRLAHPHLARALVLIAGAYTKAPGVAMAAAKVPSMPVIGPIARRTLTPSLARASMPRLIEAMFEPQPVTANFEAHFPLGLATRPSQLRAVADDGETLRPAIERLSTFYGSLDCPLAVIAGTGDAIIPPEAHSMAFAQSIPHARLVMVPAGGHMVHHSFPARIAAVVLETAQTTDKAAAPATTADAPPEPAARAKASDKDEAATPEAAPKRNTKRAATGSRSRSGSGTSTGGSTRSKRKTTTSTKAS